MFDHTKADVFDKKKPYKLIHKAIILSMRNAAHSRLFSNNNKIATKRISVTCFDATTSGGKKVRDRKFIIIPSSFITREKRQTINTRMWTTGEEWENNRKCRHIARIFLSPIIFCINGCFVFFWVKEVYIIKVKTKGKFSMKILGWIETCPNVVLPFTRINSLFF